MYGIATMTRRLSIVLVCVCLVACSCGRGNGGLSDADATLTAVPPFETAWAQRTPEPTPTPIPPVVALRPVSPDDVLGDALYTVDTNTGEIILVGGRMWLQAWLPDGRMVVIGGVDSQKTYLTDTAGGRALERLPDSTTLTVSPDGSRIAFEPLDDGSPSHEIAVSPVDDLDDASTLHVAGDVESLAWSANSEWLAIATTQDMSATFSITVVKANDLEDTRTLGNAKSFAWSPSGTQIALVDSQSVTVSDLASGKVRQRPLPAALSEMVGPPDVWVHFPPILALSPDFEYLALGFEESIVVLPIDGEGGIEMADAHFNGWRPGSKSLIVSGKMCAEQEHLRLVTAGGVVEHTFDGFVVGAARVSPDGSSVAFLSDNPSGAGTVEVADLASGTERPLFSVSHGYPGLVSWSADGRRLAFGGPGGKVLCQGRDDGTFNIHPIQ